MHRYLVVANRTLGGETLLNTIMDRMARGPAEFWVVVPATLVTRVSPALGALSTLGGFPVDPTLLPTPDEIRHESFAAATANLNAELSRLRAIGATADGAVGDPHPLIAIQNAVWKQRFDEILLSTLPPGISRWLAMDLPRRVQRRTNVPLTVITAA